MDTWERIQETVLQKALPLPEKVVSAFYKFPRDEFLSGFTLMEVYQDQPLVLFEKGSQIATVLPPVLSLKILDLLQLEEGQRVFELGTGCGWMTAMIGELVGPHGKVFSFEIIPELANKARLKMQEWGLRQVEVHQKDGYFGYRPEAPFDRILFTAGSVDFPHSLFEQLKDDGRMIFLAESYLGFYTLEVYGKKDGRPTKFLSEPCEVRPLYRKKGFPPFEKNL